MKRFHKILKIWSMAATIIILILVLTSATYAWFSINRTVSTSRATARSGTDILELQISEKGGGAFQGSDRAAIVQVNGAAFTELMPVSTADLKNFVYNPFTNENEDADIFRNVEDEKYYYHGRIYLRAVSEGRTDGAKMALYLDEDEEAGGLLAQAEEGQLLNAARLGLTFDGAAPVIYYLSEENNEKKEYNTVLNGNKLVGNQVINSAGGRLEGVDDPAVPVEVNRITMDDTRVILPERPLLSMELNRTYTVDIYFYIEGCDPDCSKEINFDEADLHLAFYGILEE